MLLPRRPWLLLPLIGCLGGDLLFQGPVFIREPGNYMFPVDSEDKTIMLSCKARGSPSPQYRYRKQDTSITGLSLEEYKLILSTDTLEEFKDMNKGMWKKLQEKFASRSLEEKYKA